MPLPYWPAEQADELNLVHRGIIAQGTQEDGVEVQFQRIAAIAAGLMRFDLPEHLESAAVFRPEAG